MGRIFIDPDAVPKMRNELTELGIRNATVYGDLPSVCCSIQSEFGF
jgi:hypothetical protein